MKKCEMGRSHKKDGNIMTLDGEPVDHLGALGLDWMMLTKWILK
jgi:hypothetical protein